MNSSLKRTSSPTPLCTNQGSIPTCGVRWFFGVMMPSWLIILAIIARMFCFKTLPLPDIITNNTPIKLVVGYTMRNIWMMISTMKTWSNNTLIKMLPTPYQQAISSLNLMRPADDLMKIDSLNYLNHSHFIFKYHISTIESHLFKRIL